MSCWTTHLFNAVIMARNIVENVKKYVQPDYVSYMPMSNILMQQSQWYDVCHTMLKAQTKSFCNFSFLGPFYKCYFSFFDAKRKVKIKMKMLKCYFGKHSMYLIDWYIHIRITYINCSTQSFSKISWYPTIW